MFQIQTFSVTSPNAGYPFSQRLRFKCRICFRFRLSQLSTFLQAIHLLIVFVRNVEYVSDSRQAFLLLIVFVRNVEYVSDSDFPSYLSRGRPSSFSSSSFGGSSSSPGGGSDHSGHGNNWDILRMVSTHFRIKVTVSHE